MLILKRVFENKKGTKNNITLSEELAFNHLLINQYKNKDNDNENDDGNNSDVS